MILMTQQLRENSAHTVSTVFERIVLAWTIRFTLLGAIIGSLSIFFLSDPHFTDRVAIVLRAILGGSVGCALGMIGSMITILVSAVQSDNKAKNIQWLKESLGLTEQDAADLAKQIKFDEKTATVTEISAHGTYFNHIISAIGEKGRNIEFTIECIKNEDGVVRFVRILPTGMAKKGDGTEKKK